MFNQPFSQGTAFFVYMTWQHNRLWTGKSCMNRVCPQWADSGKRQSLGQDWELQWTGWGVWMVACNSLHGRTTKGKRWGNLLGLWLLLVGKDNKRTGSLHGLGDTENSQTDREITATIKGYKGHTGFKGLPFQFGINWSWFGGLFLVKYILSLLSRKSG